uniref:CDP-diacylglycerol--glycerol-3-phosphate 3-phosphatidyltransferase n=1 Tax=Pinguiococcus pyrenoidosus TaxID=172671 RepID=A0A7R9YDJ2_9STRA
MHVKTLVFDDDVLLTGANMSDEYFTSRQDRYVTFSQNTDFADYCAAMVNAIASHGDEIALSDAQSAGAEDWKLAAKRRAEGVGAAMKELVADIRLLQESCSEAAVRAPVDTWVIPSVTLPGYLEQNETVLFAMLRHVEASQRAQHKMDSSRPARARVTMASAYMNLPNALVERLNDLSERGAQVELITADEQSHGFSGATGVKGIIPGLYEKLLENLVKLLHADVRLRRWRVEDWVFHGKGLWISFPGTNPASEKERRTSSNHEAPLDEGVNVSIVTSSNFGFRSFYRDLEAQVLVLTENAELQERLSQEVARLVGNSNSRTKVDTRTTPTTIVHTILASILQRVL